MQNVLTTDNRGFSLVELMVTTAIVGVMATAGAQLMIQQGKQQSTMAQKAVFTTLSSNVAATLSAPASIIWSTDPTRGTSGGNATLRTCLHPAHPSSPSDTATPSLTCTAGIPGTDDVTFDLYQNNNTTPITGFYDLTGNRLAAVTTTTACTANPKCRFQVSTKFIPNCPAVSPMVNPCNKPESLVLTYSIAQVNRPAGTTAISTIATSSASTATSPGFTMPYSMIYASSYLTAKCAVLFPPIPPATLDPLHSTVTGVDDLGQPICGPDPNQLTIDTLKTQYCNLKIAALWGVGAGGSTVAPCDIVTVSKTGFPLASPSTHTTNDCLGQPISRAIDPSGAVVTDWNNYVGGSVTVSGSPVTAAAFIAAYSITQAQTIFTCQTPSPTGAWPAGALPNFLGTVSTTGNTFYIPPNYVPGTLQISVQGGGGSGQNAQSSCGVCFTDGEFWGSGGDAGAHLTYSDYSSTVPYPCSCTATIGAGGAYGAQAAGQPTTITCCGVGKTAAGGAASIHGGSYGGSSDYGPGGGVPNHNSNGYSAPSSSYGAGGGGGERDATHDFQNGGAGASGAAQATWSVWATWNYSFPENVSG